MKKFAIGLLAALGIVMISTVVLQGCAHTETPSGEDSVTFTLKGEAL